uniref:Tll0287-like domain-containing protein n=1 Tax=Magnetococcus massalia (strain MO-1) TaxID=451514 RepID=A0A1S7LP34_MAGMO|nr:Conserved exported protein of unknown function [Candidatus Magnetococcus massalia]
MNKRVLAAVAMGMLMVSTPVMAQDEAALVAESRTAVKSLFGKLKSTLMAGMKAGGPPVAMHVCNTAAKGIGKIASKQYGGTVARTSLKPRNANNAPDGWETKVLQAFEARLAKGEDAKKMEHHEVVEMDGKRVFRYMKAIPTAAKPCLMCHGEKLSPKLVALLDEKYPEDRARGYKAGMIRGAFTLQKEMK